MIIQIQFPLRMGIGFEILFERIKIDMGTEVFAGLQKLTLLDYPGKVACTLFTKGCNFRCPFCHNASLVIRADEQIMYTNDEILAFLHRAREPKVVFC
jgi:pyruvate-formate lyase-activating enzyme